MRMGQEEKKRFRLYGVDAGLVRLERNLFSNAGMMSSFFINTRRHNYKEASSM
jgi:hypothetical protein